MKPPEMKQPEMKQQEVGLCCDCNEEKKGKIYDGDASFYCLECFNRYESDY